MSESVVGESVDVHGPAHQSPPRQRIIGGEFRLFCNVKQSNFTPDNSRPDDDCYFLIKSLKASDLNILSANNFSFLNALF